MKIISTHTFKHTLRDVHKNTENRKFCFVIGAGASRKSGIPTGKELSEKWYAEIKERVNINELTLWLSEQKIDEEDLAASYGRIYRKRFENDKISGYEFLVQAMKLARPSFGHIVLGQILSRTPGHCVLTTNFDSLIESAVYQFTNKTPLVCGHESLSGYARPSLTHPLIIKIHRDLLLEPKSDPDDINEIDPGWKEPLDYIFSTHIPIIIGYGGNDGSLLNYFKTMNKPSNFFWCGIDESNIPKKIEQIINENDGSFVKIEGFDELMHELLWVFNEIKPIKDELNEITSERVQIATRQLDEITSNKLINELNFESLTDENNELSAFEFRSMADKEPDFEKRKLIYLEALRIYPTTGWLWWSFTYFLHFNKKDFTGLEEYYEKALTYNKDKYGIIGNYAIFLSDIKKDYNKAEEYYLKTIILEPNHVNNNSNYALFLEKNKKDYIKSEEYYSKALAIEPNHVNNNYRFANFLRNIKKDYIKSEYHFLKALAIEPNNAIILGSYAIFLKHEIKDYVKAEEFYKKALDNDPNIGFVLGSYAHFMKEIKNDYLKSKELYLKALTIEPNNNQYKVNYSQILLEEGRIPEAQKLIQSALETEMTNEVIIEVWFYKYAHFIEFLVEAENKLEEFLSKGFRSIGWNFSGNIEKAIEMGHPNPQKLKDYANRITNE